MGLLWRSNKGGEPFSWKWIGSEAEESYEDDAPSTTTSHTTRGDRRSRRERRMRLSAQSEKTSDRENSLGYCGTERFEKDTESTTTSDDNDRLIQHSEQTCAPGETGRAPTDDTHRISPKIELRAAEALAKVLPAAEALANVLPPAEAFAKVLPAAKAPAKVLPFAAAPAKVLPAAEAPAKKASPESAVKNDRLAAKASPEAESAYMLGLEQRAHMFLAHQVWAAHSFFCQGQGQPAYATYGQHNNNYKTEYGYFPLPLASWDSAHSASSNVQ